MMNTITCDATKRYYIYVATMELCYIDNDYIHVMDGDQLTPDMFGKNVIPYTWDIINGFTPTDTNNVDLLEEKTVFCHDAINIKILPSQLKKYSRYVGCDYTSYGHLVYTVYKFSRVLIRNCFGIYPLHYMMPAKYMKDKMDIRIYINGIEYTILIFDNINSLYVDYDKGKTGDLEILLKSYDEKMRSMDISLLSFAFMDFTRYPGDVLIVCNVD